jgi:hypothetical protein
VGRREGADLGGLTEPCGGLVQQLCLPVPRLADSRLGHGIEGQVAQALHTSNQRKGRAVHHNLAGGVGLRDAIRHLGRQKRPATGLPADRVRLHMPHGPGWPHPPAAAP